MAYMLSRAKKAKSRRAVQIFASVNRQASSGTSFDTPDWVLLLASWSVTFECNKSFLMNELY